MDLAITGGRIFTPFQEIKDGYLLIREGRIENRGSMADLPPLPPGIQIIEAEGAPVIPGFIDIHTHGGRGFDVMDGTSSALGAIDEYKRSVGITGWVGTTITAAPEKMRKVARSCRQYLEKEKLSGLLGLHLEGPWINPQFRGAQPPEHIRRPNPVEYKEWSNHLGPFLKVITLAPEMEGSLDLISRVAGEGVLLAAGHTGADYRVGRQALEAGLSHAAHFFNGMAPFHHREPGIIGAFLDSSTATLELILDGVHLHPAAVRLAWKMAGADRIVLVTDSIRAAGCQDGTYELGGQPVIVWDGEARREDGTLAGSTLEPARALGLLREITGIGLREALFTVTVNPARCLGLEEEMGSLEPGRRGDAVILDDNYNPRLIICRGQIYRGREE